MEKFFALIRKEFQTIPATTIPALTIGLLSIAVGLVSILIVLNRGITYEQASAVYIHFFYILTLFSGMFLAIPSITYEKRYKMLHLIFLYEMSELEFISAKIIFYTFLNWIVLSILFFLYAILIIKTPYYILFSCSIGFLFLSYYASSVGVFASTITSSVPASFFLASFILLLIDIGGFLSGLLPSPAKEIFSYFHALNQFLPLSKGLLSLKNIFFFFTLGLFFHYLSILVLELYKIKGIKE